MADNPTSYDVVAYPGYSHPQTLPDRLAGLIAYAPLAADGAMIWASYWLTS